MPLSSIAGILDIYGGYRVVVTEPWRYQFHVRADEMLFMVPGVEIQEPVAWGDIPSIIQAADNCIEEYIRTRNDPDLPTSVKLYQLRRLRQAQRSTHLHDIVET